MIVVSIVGLLASIGIPNFLRFQLKAKSAEAKQNLGAIRTAEEIYFAEFGSFVGATASPSAHGDSEAIAFVDTGPSGADFATIGWQPEGRVFFNYAVAVSGGLPGSFTADASADIDGNSVAQVWGIVHTNDDGDGVAGVLGCSGVWDGNAPSLANTVGPCDGASGSTEF